VHANPKSQIQPLPLETETKREKAIHPYIHFPWAIEAGAFLPRLVIKNPLVIAIPDLNPPLDLNPLATYAWLFAYFL